MNRFIRLDLLLIKLFGNQSWDRVRFVVTHSTTGSKMLTNRKFKLMMSRVSDNVTYIANGPTDVKKNKDQAAMSVVGAAVQLRDGGTRRLSSAKLLSVNKELRYEERREEEGASCCVHY